MIGRLDGDSLIYCCQQSTVAPPRGFILEPVNVVERVDAGFDLEVLYIVI